MLVNQIAKIPTTMRNQPFFLTLGMTTTNLEGKVEVGEWDRPAVLPNRKSFAAPMMEVNDRR